MYHRSAPDKDQDPPDIHVTMNDVRSPWGWAEPRQVKPGQQVMSPGEGADIITDQWNQSFDAFHRNEWSYIIDLIDYTSLKP